MKLADILKKVSHLAVRGNVDRAVSGIAYDSRKVKGDTLFVAIPGTRCDGFQYVDDAIKHGAGVIVSPHGLFPSRDVTHVQVEDARRALADIADVFHGHPSSGLSVI